MKTKNLIFFAILVLVLVMSSSCARRAPFPPEIITVTGTGYANPQEQAQKVAEEVTPPQVVEPPDWSGERIEAIGNGVPPDEAANLAQARLMAKLAARRDAQRNLAEQLYGVQIDSNTTVRDFMTEHDVIRSKVDGLLKGFETVEEKELEDGTWEVRLAIGLEPFGEVIASEIAEPSGEKVTVTGKALVSGQARLLARRAAEVDARRKLMEYVKGARIDSYTTVENFMLKSDRINSQVRGIIMGARVVDTRYFGDGTCEVDIQFDLSRVKNLVR
jgi:hypothetical protein